MGSTSGAIANLRATWRHVLRDAPAMSAAVVLAVFIGLALLDSVHFRPRLEAAPGAAADAQTAYGTRTQSLLDVLLRHAIEAREKTYSVPLAYWSFQRETAVVDGREVREFPRLAFGGAHLQDPEREWKADLLTRSVQGVVSGLGVGVALLLAVAALRGRAAGGWRASLAEMARGETEVPWRSVLLTATVIAVLIGWLAAIWPYYHLFGTDRTGNDVLFQALKSIRTAVLSSARFRRSRPCRWR